MKIFRADPARHQQLYEERLGLVESFFIKRGRAEPDFNRRMFDEDFSTLFYSMNRRRGNLFETVSNDDQLVKKLLGTAQPRHAPHSIDKAICKLVDEIAQSLIWYGRAYYFIHDDTEQEEVHIVSFSSHGVMRLLGTHIQWVPKRTERHWESEDKELPREIRILKTPKIVRFDMPKSLKRMLSTQNKTLACLDKRQFEATNFRSAATHDNPNPINHFDFSMWNDMQERALYRAARSTGWNGRKSGSLKRSDFFDCHRLIRFRRNQFFLRDNILNQLSNELSRIGKAYNAAFSIEILGTDELPSIAHLNELEVKLAREEVGFNEIFDYCYRR